MKCLNRTRKRLTYLVFNWIWNSVRILFELTIFSCWPESVSINRFAPFPVFNRFILPKFQITYITRIYLWGKTHLAKSKNIFIPLILTRELHAYRNTCGTMHKIHQRKHIFFIFLSTDHLLPLLGCYYCCCCCYLLIEIEKSKVFFILNVSYCMIIILLLYLLCFVLFDDTKKGMQLYFSNFLT